MESRFADTAILFLTFYISIRFVIVSQDYAQDSVVVFIFGIIFLVFLKFSFLFLLFFLITILFSVYYISFELEIVFKRISHVQIGEVNY